MKHLLTVRVPESYRVRGPELVAVALFQDDAGSEPVPGVAAVFDGGPGPGRRTVLGRRRRLRAQPPPDRTPPDGRRPNGWASIWLTAAEFVAPPCALSESTELPLFEFDREEVAHSDRQPYPLRVTQCHVDPNVGRPATSDYDEDNLVDDEWEPEPNHFGGTVDYYNGFTFDSVARELKNGPWEISPWYLEFTEELGGGNSAAVAAACWTC